MFSMNVVFDERSLLSDAPDLTIRHNIKDNYNPYASLIEFEDYITPIVRAKLSLSDISSEIYIKINHYDTVGAWNEDQFEIMSKFITDCSDLIPEVYLFEKLCTVDVDYDIFLIYLLVSECWGISLSKMYNAKEGPGPTSIEILDDIDLFNEYFPKDIVPNNILAEIRLLLEELHSRGYVQDDCHGGNFLIKNDIIKIIDYDMISIL